MNQLDLITKKDQEHASNKLKGFYENDFIAPEKKTYLTKLEKSRGPYMGIETSDQETHYLLDAASQIATLGLGFNAESFFGTAHYLESWINDPTTEEFKELRARFEAFLKRKGSWEHLTTLFCNSGAEANEMALGLSYQRRKRKNANKVLAFEGSFHGRMMITLFSTWNKTKREPFQWPGFETVFTPFPELHDAKINLEIPKGWQEHWDKATLNEFTIPKEWEKDSVLKGEISCLLNVREELKKGDIFSIIIEPMQCEGGDRYASDRFHTALILMARSFGVSVIHDEVQTGFHLSNEFFWHKNFKMKDIDGHQLNPDYIVCAKKAQVGMVLCPHPIRLTELEKREQFQVASLVRGYIHALSLDQSRKKIKELEKIAKEKLDQLINKYSSHIARPRVVGLSFAFDILDKEKVSQMIAERFDHGLLYYPAGDKTLRFRLNTAFTTQDMNFLFERLESIIDHVFEGKEAQLVSSVSTNQSDMSSFYSWQELLLKTKLQTLTTENFKTEVILSEIEKFFSLKDFGELKIITKELYPKIESSIDEMQKLVYEPTRQTSMDTFKTCIESQHGRSLGLFKGDKLIAMAFSSSLKDHPLERGTRQDKDQENPNALYVIDTTVHADYRGQGIGRQMKYALSLLALANKGEKIKGRNRDQMAAGMLAINLSMGAREQLFLREDYSDFEESRDVHYYTTDLKWRRPTLNLSNRTNSSLTEDDLDDETLKSELAALCNKICLSNFVGERFLTHVKEISEQLPAELRHSYTASGQSECADKIAKSIWYNGRHHPRLLTFSGHYFGNGSFLSRSLSGGPAPYFKTDTLPHPTEDQYSEILKRLEDSLKANSYLGVWIEPLPQNKLSPVPLDFLKGIRELTKKYQTPLIFNETSSQQFSYSSDHYFASSIQEITPDACMTFLGGQAGLVSIHRAHFVAKPLMMISTWDGDEFSFSLYNKGMKKILNNKEDFLKVRKEFEEKLMSQLKRYPLEECLLHNGIGRVSGALPKFLSQSLKKEGKSWMVNPSFEAMKRFLNTEMKD